MLGFPKVVFVSYMLPLNVYMLMIVMVDQGVEGVLIIAGTLVLIVVKYEAYMLLV